MVETEEQYKFKEKIKQIEEYIIDYEFSPSDVNKIKKILFKMRSIDSITSNIDEDLYFNLISSKYNQLTDYCSRFITGQHNYLQNILDTTSSILSDISQYIDYNVLFNNKVGIKNSIKSYKSEITKQSKLAELETSKLIDEINEKKQELEDKNSNINQVISNFDIKLKELEVKNTKLYNDVEVLSNQSKEKIESLIETEKNKLENNYVQEQENIKIKFEELSKQYCEKFNNLHSEIKQKDEQISKLIDIVGEKARIGQYKKNADSSRIERFVWQGITLVLFVASFVLMFWVTVATKNLDKYVLFKYIVSAILMGAATYTGKQASNSRKDEVYYRKQELELASIDVYLENLSPENKEEIKKELSSSMFGQAQKTYTNKYDEKKVFSTEDIIKIIETLKTRS